MLSCAIVHSLCILQQRHFDFVTHMNIHVPGCRFFIVLKHPVQVRSTDPPSKQMEVGCSESNLISMLRSCRLVAIKCNLPHFQPAISLIQFKSPMRSAHSSKASTITYVSSKLSRMRRRVVVMIPKTMDEHRNCIHRRGHSMRQESHRIFERIAR
jgi:hypothetical protein